MIKNDINNFYLCLIYTSFQLTRHTWLTGLFVFAVFSNNLMAEEAQGYRFGVFPHMSLNHVEKKYAPVALAMRHLLNKPVKLGSASEMIKFRDRILKNEFDIALIPPFDIVPVVDEAGYIPLARRPSKPASIVVMEDSEIIQLDDLQGKTLGLPAGTPVDIILQLLLREQGYVGDKQILFKKFHNVQACLHKLLIKSVDACGSPTDIDIGLKIFTNRMGVKLRSIMQTQAFPHMLFVAHPGVSAVEREKLSQAILGKDKTEQGQNVYKALSKNTGYIAYKSRDYDSLRQYRKRWIKDTKNAL